jgi:hypothetical protein
MATGVLKVRVGGAWVNIGTQGYYAHRVTHEPGGADALTVLDAGILTQGALPDARLSINVLKYSGGFPGGTVNFLRADGTFSPAGVGNITGPASSVANNLAAYLDTTGKVLKDSGIPLAQVARLDSGPTFAGALVANTLQASAAGWGSVSLTHTAGGVDQKNLQMYYASGAFVMRGMSDNWGTQLGYLVFTGSSGSMSATGNIGAYNSSVVIGRPSGSWPSVQFNDSYLTIDHTSGGQLVWINATGILQLNAGQLRFGTTIFNLCNSTGTPVLTVRDNGEVNCPYFLTIPVGTDRWAPA